MFNLRGHVLPLIDLHHYLKITPMNQDRKNMRIIVTDFNNIQAGFQVDRVEQIYRISWAQMRPPIQTQKNGRS